MGKTKVLLFSPELRERTYPGRPPMYYLATALRSGGHQVVTVDVDITGRKPFLDVLLDFHPDIIGGTSLSIQINEAMELMALAKSVLPSAITVLGGTHAIAAGEYLYPVHASYLDAVASGQGLTTLAQLALAVERGKWGEQKSSVPGLMLWDGQKVHRTARLSEEPDAYSPDLSYHATHYDFDIFRREDGRPRKTFQLMTAFGCENACFFCHSSENDWGGKLRQERRMSIAKVEAILRKAARLGYEAVYFDDDTFTRRREHALALTKLCSELGLVFGCHTRPDCEDEELIRAFARDGCRYMFSGFESAVPEILLGANKTKNPEGYRSHYLRSYHLKNELGIPVSAFMIHGMPRQERDTNGKLLSWEPDTLDDSKTSLRFAIEELDPRYLSQNVLRFIPGVSFSESPHYESLRPVQGPLHGGYFDRKWLETNGKKDPRCFHPVLRAFEGSGSPTPSHMTPLRCYEVLTFSVETVNSKNRRPGVKNQTELVVDKWFMDKGFLRERRSGGLLQYEIAPFEALDSLTTQAPG